MAQLIETVLSESARKVDREQGVIHRVKILGRESRNGRTYSDRALRDAVGLYEGMKVNVDHPNRANPGVERSFNDFVGELRECKIEGDGVYGDLWLLKSKPVSETLFEAAERFPKQFGLSHNAEGPTAMKQGREVVESLENVRSVDVVGRPATNKSIFESEDEGRTMAKPRTVKQILESAPESRLKKRLSKLVEDAALDAAMAVPMEGDATPDPADEVKAALEKAAVAVIKKLFAGDLEEADAFSEIKKIIGMKDEAAGDKTGEGAPPNSDVAESIAELKKEMAGLRAENAARILLEEHSVEPKAVRVKALVECKTDADRKELLEDWPKRTAGGSNGAPRPKTSRPLVESEGDADRPMDAKSFVSRLRSGS